MPRGVKVIPCVARQCAGVRPEAGGGNASGAVPEGTAPEPVAGRRQLMRRGRPVRVARAGGTGTQQGRAGTIVRRSRPRRREVRALSAPQPGRNRVHAGPGRVGAGRAFSEPVDPLCARCQPAGAVCAQTRSREAIAAAAAGP